MKDWGWENRGSGTELALFLNLEADFSPGSDNHRWFAALKLKQYARYDGPFHEHPQTGEAPICAFLEKPFYKELVLRLKEGVRMSYASFYHYIYLKPTRLIFVRAWGDNGTSTSDSVLIQLLLERGIGIGEWLIQDLDYGNEWIRAQGTESFKAYLES